MSDINWRKYGLLLWQIKTNYNYPLHLYSKRYLKAFMSLGIPSKLYHYVGGEMSRIARRFQIDEARKDMKKKNDIKESSVSKFGYNQLIWL